MLVCEFLSVNLIYSAQVSFGKTLRLANCRTFGPKAQKIPSNTDEFVPMDVNINTETPRRDAFDQRREPTVEPPIYELSRFPKEVIVPTRGLVKG